VQIFESVRDLIPPDLERRLAEALRELLLALRALIDWYLERAEQRRREPADVQDIPIA
jgi:DNA-binding HxlR family transcriptional regulator